MPLRTDYADEENEAQLQVWSWSDEATVKISLVSFEGVPFTMALMVPKGSTKEAVAKAFRLMLEKEDSFVAMLAAASRDHKLDAGKKAPSIKDKLRAKSPQKPKGRTP